MARIVMKFGGTSMAGTERIRAVAARVKREVDAGHQVAVVVSAMAGETDRLVNFCREASSLYDAREYDVVVASGEQVTSGLLAIALQAIGVPARSWLGWQLPIDTTAAHGSARIEAIAMEAALSTGEVAVIPGFQGVS
ncbi:MAG: aspartate kinase, partial [Sphingobium sp.]|nr:aspartate kinase [Sphingobium sp.]